MFYGIVSSQFATVIDMKQFSAWLNTQGLRGGISKNSIQGGGELNNPHFDQAIKQWLTK